MKMLKHINLSYSWDLTEIPDFSGVPNLEYLILVGCSNLVSVHASIGKLKKLVRLNLSGCNQLQNLPGKLKSESLMELNLSCCFQVKELPKFEKGMKELSFLDASSTCITELPESFGYLTGLQELNLSNCDFRNGSIFDHFGNLSSLIVLDLGGNAFVNYLPDGFFSSLFLNGCRLKSLPKLPPRLIRLEVMRPYYLRDNQSLTNDQLWNLVASLNHQYRSRTRYASPLLNNIKPEHLPQRDFFAIFSGSDIPSWFPNKEHAVTTPEPFHDLVKEFMSSFYDDRSHECVMKVDIPQHFHASEWSGIVVCLCVSKDIYHKLSGVEYEGNDTCWISWSSKALEDEDYIYKGWDHCFRVIDYPDKKIYVDDNGYDDGAEVTKYLCVMVLELNEKTCWQHLTPHNNSIHIRLRLHRPNVSWDFKMLGWGWRVLCKEDIE
ncbi:disease resistance protein Roq1-like [Prosopis cineraria]|uniref:disease resistance protein Roq1-like n=1 Tax=Prosopis cineraria TaxID=364024 RepID=UPI0024102B14|nr:disease resistance protein Roq1-like [Prosopis cineraria]